MKIDQFPKINYKQIAKGKLNSFCYFIEIITTCRPLKRVMY